MAFAGPWTLACRTTNHSNPAGIKLFGRTQDAQRWTVFRYTNLVHNTQAVNNQHQLVEGYAPITASSAAPAFMHAVTDISAVYKGALAKATIAVLPSLTKLMWWYRMKWKPSTKKPPSVESLLTPANVTITGTNQCNTYQRREEIPYWKWQPRES